MTAFVASDGLINNFDAYTGGSVVATLDTYAISNQSTLVVRTDTYSCPNHTVAFGSLDTVTFTGTGGELKFDPTYARIIAYTGGSGTSPAYGTTITSTGGATGVFLGAWTTWQSEPIVAGAAIGSAGFIKVGGVVGTFTAGTLTGIAATCSGADVQGWIEIRGSDTATITVPRIGKVTSNEAWFELGTTNGTRGQIIPCPTTATAVNMFPGVWVETTAGSGIYEPWGATGTIVALTTQRLTSDAKVFNQTTGGIRFGTDGTNNAFYLPPTGCKVRIPAIILTNCTRTASGSGPRVLPNATVGTRQELVTTGAGYFDIRGLVSQWYMNFQQAFYVKYKSCAQSDLMNLYEIASPLDVDDCIVSPTQAQSNFAFNVISCFAGGTVKNSVFNRFAMAASGNYVAQINFATNVVFSGNTFRSSTLRANANTGCIASTQAVNCTFTNEKFIGGRGTFVGAQRSTFNNLTYYDHTLTTTTTSTNPVYALEFTTGGNSNTVTGMTLPLPNNGPYNGLVSLNACYGTIIKQIGTSSLLPLVMTNTVTGVGVTGVGNNDGITIKRMYLSGTRTGPYSFVNSDTNILVENSSGDYADTSVVAGLNAIVKNSGLTGATTGQVSVYGSHWLTRFTSATAGFAEILCNEPTASSALQCYESGGTPQFNSSGSVLLTKVGDSVTWEMPFFAIGYTAFTNSVPVITGTNVTFGTRWGNHDIEFQVNTGNGYGGTWLNLTAANLTAQTFNSSTGFKLKIRATCAIAAAANVITNMRVNLTTTATEQSTNLYPLQTVNLSLTGIQDGSDIVILQANTSNILTSQDSLIGNSFDYVYETVQNVDIGILKPSYVPLYIRNYPLSSVNSSLPISQTFDRNYGA